MTPREREAAIEARARHEWETDRQLLIRLDPTWASPPWASVPDWRRRAYLLAAEHDVQQLLGKLLTNRNRHEP